jgi:hypothetical protein
MSWPSCSGSVTYRAARYLDRRACFPASGAPNLRLPPGHKLAASYEAGPSQAFDEFLQVWLRQHGYFRAFIGRLSAGPLHIPDITSIKDLNGHAIEKTSPDAMAAKVAETCVSRLKSVGVAVEVRNGFRQSALDRFAILASEVSLASLDAKGLVEPSKTESWCPRCSPPKHYHSIR